MFVFLSYPKKVCKIVFLTKTILFVLLLLPTIPSNGQELAQKETVTLNEITEYVSREHNVNFFYQSDWFKQQAYPAAILERKLDIIIQELSANNELQAVQLDGNVFFIPKDQSRRLSATKTDENTVIVGNPDEYGRYSRATIRGIVIDGTTSEPLFGAGVFEPLTRTGTTTDFDGKFELELPVGNHRLRYSYMGYAETYQEITLVSDGDLEFHMFGGVQQLSEVTVRARQAEQNISRTQMSLINLDPKALGELPQSFGEVDIVRSITLLPGVQSVGEFGTGFNVRGGSADQNLILVENAPLFNSSHLFGLISVINPDMVGNVSLMKAGIPARYGERASSIMSVNLQNSLDAESFGFKGGLGLLSSRALLQIPLVEDRVAISLGGRSSYSDWYITNLPDEDLMNSEAGFHDLTFLSNVVINDNNRLTLFGYYSYDNFRFSEETDFNYSNTMGSIRWNSFINPRWNYTMLYSLSNYEYNVTDMPAARPFEHMSMNSLVNYQSLKGHFSFTPGTDHSIEIGASLIRYNIDPGHRKPYGHDSAISELALDRESAVEMSAFVSDDIILGDRWSMEMGLRYTRFLNLGPSSVNVYDNQTPTSDGFITDTLHFDKNETVKAYDGLEPRFGLRYMLGENNSLKLSYNRNFQYINLISNTAVMTPADIWKLSDYHVKPLRSDQLALGYFHNFSENTIETSFEAYYKTIKNAIEYKSGAEIVMNEFLEQDITTAQGYNYGFELYANKNSGTLTGWTSYTYSNSMRRTQSEFERDQINGNEWFPSDYDRPHNLVANLNYNATRRVRIGATFSYSTGRPVTLPENIYSYGYDYLVSYSDRNKYRLPDYHRLDISLTFGESLKLNQKGKSSWTLSLMNVYSRKNPYSVFYRRETPGSGRNQSFNLYQLYIIGRPLPTLTYNFSF